MGKIKFTKMVASGNDFVIIENREPKPENRKLSILAKKICDRKFGIGADGLLLLEKSKIADVKMRIFNADGSEAEMCGNGARCVALFSSHVRRQASHVNIETKAGIIKSEIIKGDNVYPVRNTERPEKQKEISNGVKIKLTDPKNIKLDIPIRVNHRNLKVNFIDTGVPHVVIFVEGLKKINVNEIGRAVRFHKNFSPRGTNVDFAEVLSKNLIGIRTYERGVEDETLACGTGTVAAALIFSLKTKTDNSINVQTKSGEVLRVHLKKIAFSDNSRRFSQWYGKVSYTFLYHKKFASNFREVWLEGKASIVHKGEYYV